MIASSGPFRCQRLAHSVCGAYILAMNFTHIALTIAVGIVAAWVTGKLMRDRSLGLIGDIAVGIVGGIVGVWIFARVGVAAYGLAGAVLMSVVGRVLVLFAIRMVKKA